MLNARQLIEDRAHVLFITLDSLRYDAAQRAFAAGMTPNLAALLPASGWERRHTPGNFTLSAHAAFFSGFLPTPVTPGPHPRLFAGAFPGSETTTDRTFAYEEAHLPAALQARGYRTLCLGGVGFFNKQTPLGRVLPDYFETSVWDREHGVTDPESTRNQVRVALRHLRAESPSTPFFLFLNVSAIHQPSCLYTPGAEQDSVQTQMDALAYVDGELNELLDHFQQRKKQALVIICSDHGTAFGEDGYHGHRLSHPVVWDVPYAAFTFGTEVDEP